METPIYILWVLANNPLLPIGCFDAELPPRDEEACPLQRFWAGSKSSLQRSNQAGETLNYIYIHFLYVYIYMNIYIYYIYYICYNMYIYIYVCTYHVINYVCLNGNLFLWLLIIEWSKKSLRIVIVLVWKTALFFSPVVWLPQRVPLKSPENVDLVGGWATPLKNMKVNWDDEIPNIWDNKIHVPNHQPVIYGSASNQLPGFRSSRRRNHNSGIWFRAWWF